MTLGSVSGTSPSARARCLPDPESAQSHVDYVGEVVLAVAQRSEGLRRFRIVEQAPWLSTARFEPL